MLKFYIIFKQSILTKEVETGAPGGKPPSKIYKLFTNIKLNIMKKCKKVKQIKNEVKKWKR